MNLKLTIIVLLVVGIVGGIFAMVYKSTQTQNVQKKVDTVEKKTPSKEGGTESFFF